MADSPLGGLLEGYLTARQKVEARERELADRAIQQARMEQDRQELSLRRDQFGLQKENTRIDNERLQQALANTMNNQADLSARGWTGLGIRQQGVNLQEQKRVDAIARLNTEQDAKKKQLVSKRVNELMLLDYPMQQATEMAYNEVDTIDQLIGKQDASVLGSPDLRQSPVGSGLQNFGVPQGQPQPAAPMGTPPAAPPMGQPAPMAEPAPPVEVSQKFAADPAAKPFLTGREVVANMGQPNESSPKAQRLTGEANSRNDLRAASVARTKLQNKLAEGLFPFKIADARLRGPYLKARTELTKAQTKGQELLNKSIPGLKDAQIDNLQARTGGALAAMNETLKDIAYNAELRRKYPAGSGYTVSNGTVRANPADPRHAGKAKEQNRSILVKARENNAGILRDMAKAEKSLGELRKDIAGKMLERDEIGSGDPAAMDAANAELLSLNAQAGKTTKALRELESAAKAQQDAIEEIEKEQRQATKDYNDATNTRPLNGRPTAYTNPPKEGAKGWSKVAAPIGKSPPAKQPAKKKTADDLFNQYRSR